MKKKMKEYDELRNELNFKLNDNFLYFIMINKTAIILCGGKGTDWILSKKFQNVLLKYIHTQSFGL